ncbi:MAG: transcriptional repressor [Chloroflexi bacterium]|nr:transcriptional repressor [Chloroflexota bacterium]
MSPVRSRLEEVIAKLRARGNRITPQRIAILRALISSPEHPSVERIHELVRQDLPTTSIASVYKTIELLKEAGEVLELEFDQANHYDGQRPYPHPHLVCVKCRRIVDPDTDGLEDLGRHLAERAGYRLVGQRFDVYGICPVCQSEPMASPPGLAPATGDKQQQGR